MYKKSQQSRRYLTPALLAAIVLTVPIRTASATWFPDLIFPKVDAVPDTKADRIVTGTIPRGESHTERDRSPNETRKGPSRGNSGNSKEVKP
ncbi:hypothetical protein JNB88_31800 [Rhizobium cauense]|uniref:hypothetical protein n=1 Tax=Rhizobium cauense TaxID=1166683 RepID=UPI001C6F0371|nr:hypothetical protein [Rhizobium cauense]MBW9118201.1 hypothetical protein [Rhizobium cauense]